MNNTLTHHGRLGMHWGERNGPPYPLDSSQLSSSEKRASNDNLHAEMSLHSPAKLDSNGDYIYEKGTILGRIVTGTDAANTYDGMYVFTNESDRDIYLTRNKRGNYEMVLECKNNIKAPSEINTFKLLMKCFSEDREQIISDPYYYWKEYIDNDGPSSNTFIKYLSNNGYNAFPDLKDKDYVAEDPLRLINPDDCIDIIDVVDRSSLKHYASPYYDPEYQHRYYEEHKQLKGRRQASKLNDEGKDIWAVTKDNITTEKKSKVEEEKTKRDTHIEQLRNKAKTTKENISSNFKRINKALSDKAQAKKDLKESDKKANIETIEEQKKSKIEQIRSKSIPSGLSKEERAKYTAERNAEIAKIRGDANSEKTRIREGTAEQKKQISAEASAAKEQNSTYAKSLREQTAANLKSTVQAARNAYKAAKESIDSSYEDIYQQEYDKIAAEYGKTGKKKK